MRSRKLKVFKSKGREGGFSLVELIIAMTVMLIVLSVVSTLVGRAFSVRARESRTADALAAAEAAISVMSREIANSGFGIYNNSPTNSSANNGIVLSDSSEQQIRVRANLDNAGGTPTAPDPSTLQISSAGEDVSYFFDPDTRSIVRHDAITNETSVVVNQISNVRFAYIDYALGSSTPTSPSTTPTANTARVVIRVDVELERVVGQPDNQFVTLQSAVTLRNNNYMLQQY
ncbi:MAG: prepilin-type N-terminal cleavage/methylation domain-containing protein [Acidobacteria bacterium]|nr:prepilin-type N-terminal cleavage/methylation domain-containing protein [Acidobacteriota bacterium]